MSGSVAVLPGGCAELLAAMIAIDSVNGAISGRPSAEAELVAFVETKVTAFGLDVRRLAVPGQADDLLVACEVAAGAPWLLFECHLDTVGVEGMTVAPFGARVTDGRIHGRGACDAKGAAAAMLWALRAYASEPGREANVALLLTVDEELTRTGIDAFLGDHLAALGGPIRGAVVGEPTGLRLVVAHNGVVRLTIRTEGRAAHSSDPSQGRSAISQMVTVVQALESRYIPGLSAAHPLTGPAVASVNVIRGGTQVNIIPAACEIELDRRVAPGEDGQTVVAEIEGLLSRLRAEHPDLEVSTREPVIHAPLDPGRGERFARDVAVCLTSRGAAPEVIGAAFGSDAGALSAAGIPSLLLGPGDIALAHGPDEWLDLSELGAATEAYLAIMRAGA